ncbi:MAG: septum formation protein Maf [Flavobacteriales bacterium CG_4_9_14_0_2_um_filter_35_242]|nr:septum formation protein Maf [Zetaproteobacteria bacterium]NDK18281.1 septum formation protein Maf [Flavobacteriales bacterium]OIO11359.1 MAG: septum formation protein Maf [Flavobacteriaceae bacterium CG1_02_35_72]PIV16791.1 MAG: septum formation protein Maf [Flavobacteriales bacterium CG03_land_8_20_14_0_80_35_15]PIX07169.1 MAG: septum formation protein Maf [Flavobacteriales bacterium CG_4_8_14_3_um_filter_35_10]PJA04551.1 MAG: septum formation protein Maf [Flavobacteriales bacterium CG_4_
MNTEKLSTKQLILASGSPRRQSFLKELGLNFKVELNEVEETYPKQLKKEAITNYLALKKAQVFTNLKNNDLLITADTIVWFKNKALGKPENIEQAREMLEKLSNHKHLVITSVCLKSTQKEQVFSCTTEVYFDKLSKECIDYYLKNYKPLDKAGAYGIQEWIGYVGVKKIKGSYFNVMGFPVHKFYKELMRF